MATCTLNDNTTKISSGVQYTGTLMPFTDPSVSFSYTMVENSTARFNIRLYTVGTTPSVILKLYEIRENGAVLVGTAYLKNAYNVFEHEGVVGDYFFCLETVSVETDYEMVVDFADYNGVVFVKMNAYDGEYSEFEFPEPLLPQCKSEVDYKLIDGKLPEGLEMNALGYIWGTIVEQDCVTPDDVPPSFTWFEDRGEVDVERWATTRDYRIVIRAYLREAPYVFHDRVFWICVTNNWDKDRDAFIEQDFEQLEYVCEDEQ